MLHSDDSSSFCLHTWSWEESAFFWSTICLVTEWPWSFDWENIVQVCEQRVTHELLFKSFSSEFDSWQTHCWRSPWSTRPLLWSAMHVVAAMEQWRALTCTPPSEVVPWCWPRLPSTVCSVCWFWALWRHIKIAPAENASCDPVLTDTLQCGSSARAGLWMCNSPETLLLEFNRSSVTHGC